MSSFGKGFHLTMSFLVSSAGLVLIVPVSGPRASLSSINYESLPMQ